MNQSTHSRLANSTASKLRQAPCGMELSVVEAVDGLGTGIVLAVVDAVDRGLVLASASRSKRTAPHGSLWWTGPLPGTCQRVYGTFSSAKPASGVREIRQPTVRFAKPSMMKATLTKLAHPTT